MPTLSTEQLRQFALERHFGQPYGDEPYVVHLDDVAAVARQHGLGEAYVRAAYGHDLLDDTDTTASELRELFGETESDLIYAVSGPGATRSERRRVSIERLTRHPAAVDLKVADRLSNVRSAIAGGRSKIMQMYLREDPAYERLFAMAKPSLLAELLRVYEEARACLPRGRRE